MIYLISARKYPVNRIYEQIDLPQFHDWYVSQSAYQLDIETNVVDDLTLRKLYVVQFGDVSGDIQFVHDYASYNKECRDYLHKVMDDRSKEKLIFNAQFEYSVLKQCTDIDIDNIYDIYLAMKVILNGKYVNPTIFSLKNAAKEYLGVTMSKDEQKTFDGGVLTLDQIQYAAKDVEYLGMLKKHLESLEEYPVQEFTIRNECRALRGFGDCIYNGFGFNKPVWEENLNWAIPQIEEAQVKVFSYVTGELKEECEELGFLQKEDEVDLNWNSSQQKTLILGELFPELTNFKKPALIKFEKTLPEDNMIRLLLDKKESELNAWLLKDHSELLERHGFLKRQGAIHVNLNSPVQRLELFKLVEPHLEDTKNENLVKCKHPMIDDYLDFISKDKLRSSYGTNWYEFIDADGKIRPRFIDQVVSTGRISVKPHLQTIPADDYYLYDKYRRAFLPDPGWKFSAVDYKSQELAVIAYMCQEPVWLDAIRHGKDLHSISAAKIYKQRWIDAGGDPEGNSKPSTPEGKQMRDVAKTINFLLAYGGGASTLAKRMGIPIGEASQAIENYFIAFPNIKRVLDQKSWFAVRNGYSLTLPPFNRRRYFPFWDPHYMEDKERSAIERQGRNAPIQGSSADQTKIALILIKDYIDTNRIRDCVKLVFQLHDATLTSFRPEVIPEWPGIHTQLMEDAACINIPGHLIKGDQSTTDHWTK